MSVCPSVRPSVHPSTPRQVGKRIIRCWDIKLLLTIVHRHRPPTLGLTPGLIAVLHKQLGSNELLTSDEILEKWLQLALPKEQFDELLRLGGFKDKVKVRWVGLFASCSFCYIVCLPLAIYVTLYVCLLACLLYCLFAFRPVF